MESVVATAKLVFALTIAVGNYSQYLPQFSRSFDQYRSALSAEVAAMEESQIFISESGASSAINGYRLNEYLRQWEKYGTAGLKDIDGSRYRFYGPLKPASTAGEMIGSRRVREWNWQTDSTRTWMDTLDTSGRSRIIRPQTDGPKVHFYFDEFGNYSGRW